MTNILIIIAIALLVACLTVLVLLLRRGSGGVAPLISRLDLIERGQDKSAAALRDELGRGRTEAAESARQLREEVLTSIKSILDSVVKSIAEAGHQQAIKLDGFASQLSRTNEVSQENGRLLRDDVTKSLQTFMEAALTQVKESAQSQKDQLTAFSERLGVLTNAIDARLKDGQERNEKQIAAMRAEMTENIVQIKTDTTAALSGFKDSVVQQAQAATALQKTQLDGFATQLGDLSKSTEQKLASLRETIEQRLGVLQEANDKKLTAMREEGAAATQAIRNEITRALGTFQESVQKQISENAASQRTQMGDFLTRLNGVAESNEKKLEALRTLVDARLKELQESNDKRLDQMRHTVDEKLQGTLEKRLGESFKLVSDRLELVHKGLGEMQTLASGVGDLKKVLTNVKTRGTWRVRGGARTHTRGHSCGARGGI